MINRLQLVPRRKRVKTITTPTKAEIMINNNSSTNMIMTFEQRVEEKRKRRRKRKGQLGWEGKPHPNILATNGFGFPFALSILPLHYDGIEIPK